MSTTEQHNESGTQRRRRRGGRNRNQNNNQNRGGRHRGGRNRSRGNKKKEEPKNLIARFLAWLFPSGEEEQRQGNRSKRNDRQDRSDRGRQRRDRSQQSAAASGDEETTSRSRERRKPEAYEIVTPRLYVGNLAYETVESDLFGLFESHGQVKNVEVVFGRSGKSKGFGFVEMDHLEAAKRAADELNQTEFMGRQIIVSGAKVK